MATTAEETMMRKIKAGEKIERPEEMTSEYREHLVNLLTMQADSELAGAYGYVPWIMKAPTMEEKYVVSLIVKDEVRHAHAIYKLLRDLGVDTESHIQGHDFTSRLDQEVDLGAKRAADDKRVNIFYYPIETWTDFIMFNFCMDRGAGHQLHDVLECSYGPWARAIEQIFREELMHVAHGDKWVEKLAKNPATRDDCQQSLNKWYLRTMNIFGRKGSRRNALYCELGLKKRDNDEVRWTFHREVKEKAGQWGLTLPKWEMQQG